MTDALIRTRSFVALDGTRCRGVSRRVACRVENTSTGGADVPALLEQRINSAGGHGDSRGWTGERNDPAIAGRPMRGVGVVDRDHKRHRRDGGAFR